jgi:hypothetical protein
MTVADLKSQSDATAQLLPYGRDRLTGRLQRACCWLSPEGTEVSARANDLCGFQAPNQDSAVSTDSAFGSFWQRDSGHGT